MFKTVVNPTETEIVIERSRFITYVAPCATESEARGILAERKKTHYQATHNCYAYIAENGECSKFSDDGEPGGTAGQPIMSAIKSAELKNVIVVVTRYFGGIKLGAGGLTRAYLRCAAEGIRLTPVVVYEKAIKIKVELPYEDHKTFSRLLSGDVKLTGTEYSDKVTLTVMVKSEAIGRFSADFTELFSGRYAYVTLGEEYFSF